MVRADVVGEAPTVVGGRYRVGAKPYDDLGHRVGVGVRHAEPPAVADDLRHSPGAFEANDRPLEHRCLEPDDRARILARGDEEDVRGGEIAKRLVREAGDVQTIGDTEPIGVMREACEVLTARRSADPEENERLAQATA